MTSDTGQKTGSLSSSSDAVRESFVVVQSHWTRFIAIQVFGLVPLLFLAAWYGLGALFLSVRQSLFSSVPGPIILILAGGVGVLGVATVVYFAVWSKVAQLLFAADSSQQEPEAVIRAIRAARPLIWGYLGISVLYGLITLGGLLLFIIPGILWYWKYLFISLTYVFDHETRLKGAGAVLAAAAHLTQGYRLALFVRMLVLGLVLLGVQFLVQFSGNMLLGLAQATKVGFVIVVMTGLVSMASAVVSILSGALSAVYQFRFFEEAKELKAR